MNFVILKGRSGAAQAVAFALPAEVDQSIHIVEVGEAADASAATAAARESGALRRVIPQGQDNGKKTLVTRDSQHEYVFTAG